MQLLDLPLDIIRLVFQEAALSFRFDQLNHIRLVNKTFDRGVTDAVSTLLSHPRLLYRASPLQAVDFIYQAATNGAPPCYTLPLLIARTVDYLLDHTDELEKSKRETYIRKLCQRAARLMKWAYYPCGTRKRSCDCAAPEQWPIIEAAAAALLGCHAFLAGLPNSNTVIFQCSQHFGSPLAAAASSGELSTVQWILGRYLELGHRKDSHIRHECAYAFQDACLSGNEAVVREFLYRKYRLRQRTHHWEQAFKDAGTSGNVEVVAFIANHRKFWRDGLNLALGEACRQGHAAVVAYCLSQGAEPTKPMSRGLKYSEQRLRNSPFSLAAWRGHYEVVKIISSHVDGQPQPEYQPHAWRPGVLAAWRGHKNIVEFLLENDSETHAEHLLGTAAWGGHADMVKYLLQELAKISPSSKIYATALEHAEKRGWTSVADQIRREMN